MSEVQEKDSITDLRLLMNKDLFKRESFFKFLNLIKVLPMFYELAKQND